MKKGTVIKLIISFLIAVLIPILTKTAQGTFSSRGLYGARRELELLLLLVEVETGKIIWHKNRHVSKVSYGKEREQEALFIYPKWDILYTRLFHQTLWQNFPGKIQI